MAADALADTVAVEPNHATWVLAAAFAGGAPPTNAVLIGAAQGRAEMRRRGFDVARVAGTPDVADDAHAAIVARAMAAGRAARVDGPPVPRAGDAGRAVNVLKTMWGLGYGIVPYTAPPEDEI